MQLCSYRTPLHSVTYVRTLLNGSRIVIPKILGLQCGEIGCEDWGTPMAVCILGGGDPDDRVSSGGPCMGPTDPVTHAFARVPALLPNAHLAQGAVVTRATAGDPRGPGV